MVIHLYILKCADASYYTGVTNNLERRQAEHESGGNPRAFTFRRRPVKLVYTKSFSDPYVAFQKEKQIKGWSRKKKEALINKNWEELKRLSKSTLRQAQGDDDGLASSA